MMPSTQEQDDDAKQEQDHVAKEEKELLELDDGTKDKKEMSLYETIDAVDTSWNRIRSIPNYEAVAGEILFRKIFELAPGALGMYSFGARFQVEEDGLYSSPLFQRHAKGVVRMLDAAIQMLGPDMEPLSKVLNDLGAKHTHYGVLPPHYAVVGQALIHTLETALGDDWTPQVQMGWEGIYQFVSSTMMKGAEDYLAMRISKEEEKRSRDCSNPVHDDKGIKNTTSDARVIPAPPISIPSTS